MSKFKLKIAVLLGIVFCMGLLQMAASDHVEADKKAGTPSKIRGPAGGFTIVLRKPMSGNPQVIKIDENGGTECIQGRSVYLPKKTPIFFRVDEVNTVLYDVNITVKEEAPKLELPQVDGTSGIFGFLSVIKTMAGAKIEKSKREFESPEDALRTLKLHLQEAKKLNSKLDELLYSSEMPQFLGFANIKSSAASAVGDGGTSKQFCDRAAITIAAVYKAFDIVEATIADVEKEKKVLVSRLTDLFVLKELYHCASKDAKKEIEEIIKKVENQKSGSVNSDGFVADLEKLRCLSSKDAKEKVKEIIEKVEKQKEVRIFLLNDLSVLKELCDPSSKNMKEAVAFFDQTAKKLRMIETAKWRKDDTQERILLEKIEYKCIITPAMALPAKYPKLQREEFVVTVRRTTELSGRKVTFGSFFTDLHDDTYVEVDKRIAIGVQDRFSEGFGVLTHIPLYKRNFTRFRGAAALSGGLGLDNLSNNKGDFSLLQLPTMLGGSLLFAAPKSESLLALTGGVIVKPVARLNGYSVGQTFPGKDVVTRRVRTVRWFFAITVSYDIWGALGQINIKREQKND